MPYITNSRQFLSLSPDPFDDGVRSSSSSIHHPTPLSPSMSLLSASSSSSSRGQASPLLSYWSSSADSLAFLASPFFSTPELKAKLVSVVHTRPGRSSTPSADLHHLPERLGPGAGLGIFGRHGAGEGEKGWQHLGSKLGRERNKSPSRQYTPGHAENSTNVETDWLTSASPLSGCLSPTKLNPIRATAPRLSRASPEMSPNFMGDCCDSSADLFDLPGKALGLLPNEFLFWRALRG